MKAYEFLQAWFKDSFEASTSASQQNTLTVVGPARGPFESYYISNVDCLNADKLNKVGKKIYFRVHGLAKAPGSPSKRGDQRSTNFVPGFVLDIDVEGPGKTHGKNYFPTKADAISWVVKTIPYSFIVDSGTGIHVYVQIQGGYWISEGETERWDEIYALSRAFAHWAKDKCPCTLDSVYDLARVLTLPGVGEAQVIESTGKSFPLENFQNTLRLRPRDRMVSSTTEAGEVNKVDLKLDENCALPQGTLGLATANRDFAQSWALEKHPADASPSGYRFSMISYAMGAGWQPQDAANLAIRFLIDRKGYTTEQCKLDRPDLWVSEINKCRISGQSPNEILEGGDKDDIIQAMESLMTLPTGCLNKVHKVRVGGVFEESAEGCDFIFSINTVDGRTASIKTSNITNRAEVVKSVLLNTGHLMEVAGGNRGVELRKMWNQMCVLAWRGADELETIVSTAYEGFIQSLHAHLQSDVAADPEEAKATGNPMVDEEEEVVVVPVAAFLSRQAVINPDLKNGRLVAACAARYAKELGIKESDFKKRWYKKVNFTCYVIPLDKIRGVIEGLS